MKTNLRRAHRRNNAKIRNIRREKPALPKMQIVYTPSLSEASQKEAIEILESWIKGLHLGDQPA